jgi:hypothetical protein
MRKSYFSFVISSRKIFPHYICLYAQLYTVCPFHYKHTQYVKYLHLLLRTKLYVLHKLHIDGEFPISIYYSARNVQKCTRLKSLKFNQNTEILKWYFKIISFCDFGEFWHQIFPYYVVVIYSSMSLESVAPLQLLILSILLPIFYITPYLNTVLFTIIIRQCFQTD